MFLNTLNFEDATFNIFNAVMIDSLALKSW